MVFAVALLCLCFSSVFGIHVDTVHGIDTREDALTEIQTSVETSVGGSVSAVPVYRYWNGRKHFYTANGGEIGIVNAGERRGEWRCEGIGFYAPVGGATPNTVPFYRFYNPWNNNHFYSSDRNEVNRWWGYRYEGVAFYVWSYRPSNALTNCIGGLHRYSSDHHFYTTNANELGVPARPGTGVNYDGISAYVLLNNNNNYCRDPFDPCASNNGGCSALTTCTRQDNSRTCSDCPKGYSGNGANGCPDINECLTDNGGCHSLVKCTNTPGSRTCGACPSGYTGDGLTGCADVNECAVNSGGCDQLTVCTNIPGSFTCSACPAGYTGTGLSGCLDIDECAANNGGCDPVTSCTNTPGSRTCGDCPSGYTGNGATKCADINECAVNNGGCFPAAVCTNNPGSFSCGGCPKGFTAGGPLGCLDVNECLSNNGNCDTLTTCTNTDGDRTCGACPAGFMGDGIVGCTDVNECVTNNGGCDPLTKCTNHIGSFECSPCPAGYSGIGSQAGGCTDIDECATNNGGCHILAVCTNTKGGFACGSCPIGFDGNGDTGCVDRDECLTNNGGCSDLSKCINTRGSRQCTPCPAGYSGDGVSCSDVDECGLDHGGCDPRVKCNNTPGSRTCGDCPPGFDGDGYTGCKQPAAIVPPTAVADRIADEAATKVVEEIRVAEMEKELEQAHSAVLAKRQERMNELQDMTKELTAVLSDEEQKRAQLNQDILAVENAKYRLGQAEHNDAIQQAAQAADAAVRAKVEAAAVPPAFIQQESAAHKVSKKLSSLPKRR